LTNTIKSNSITVNNPINEISIGINFDPNNRVLNTTMDGSPKGFYFDFHAPEYTIGEKNSTGIYFGINTGDGSLVGGGIRVTGNYFTPAGAIPIVIDGTTYYIELWT
jgi:hypothetical protein